MKKKMMYAICLLFFAVCLTGCGGSNKLTCTMKQTVNLGNSYGDATAKVSMNFGSDGYVSYLQMDFEIVDTEGKNDLNSLEKMALQEVKQRMAEGAADLSSSVKGNTIYITAKMDSSKIVQKRTKQEAIDNFQAQGYTCK